MGQGPHPEVAQRHQGEQGPREVLLSAFANQRGDHGSGGLAQACAHHEGEHEGIAREVADLEFHHAHALDEEEKLAHVEMVKPNCAMTGMANFHHCRRVSRHSAFRPMNEAGCM